MAIVFKGLAVGGPADGQMLQSDRARKLNVPQPGGRIFSYVYVDIDFSGTHGGKIEFFVPDGKTVVWALKQVSTRYADGAGRRINDLLEANNRYQQETRDARAVNKVLKAEHNRLQQYLDAHMAAETKWRHEYDALVERLQVICEDYDKPAAAHRLDWIASRLEELKDVRAELAATGHDSTGASLSNLVDKAIDMERSRHHANLERIAKALGQEWSAKDAEGKYQTYENWSCHLANVINMEWKRKFSTTFDASKFRITDGLPPDVTVMDYEWPAATPADQPSAERPVTMPDLSRAALEKRIAELERMFKSLNRSTAHVQTVGRSPVPRR